MVSVSAVSVTRDHFAKYAIRYSYFIILKSSRQSLEYADYFIYYYSQVHSEPEW